MLQFIFHQEDEVTGDDKEFGRGKKRVGQWELSPTAVLSLDQASRLRRHARHASEARGLDARDWFLVDFAMSSGLRVSELAQLRVEDVVLDHLPRVIVVNGKGSKRRVVFLDNAIAAHVQAFLSWKNRHGEPTAPDAPLLWSSRTRGPLTVRALQKACKRFLIAAGLPDECYSIHNLRHTYATYLYRASGNNLRFVQKQLGHSRITTTQVYADILAEDVKRLLDHPLYESNQARHSSITIRRSAPMQVVSLHP